MKQKRSLDLAPLIHRCTGLYTCTSDQNQSYSQYLLIDRGHGPLSFSCSLDSYTRRVLQCSLAEELTYPSLVRVKANSSNMDHDWKEMKISGDQLLVFDVPLPDFCFFEEQVHPINVSIEIMADGEYRTGHKSIYIRDVVVPRAPENLSVANEKIVWSNPSWTSHPSFFRLLFELQINYRNNTDVMKTTEEPSYNVKDVRRCKVRCRDLYNPCRVELLDPRTEGPVRPGYKPPLIQSPCWGSDCLSRAVSVHCWISILGSIISCIGVGWGYLFST
ncbi:interleukin-12 subunit beta-like [Anomaloglossus baeobatrachus]|uniref:interleukin-12 subunit beta-like n=1 Tax=Anomaloglossus baeobatrachus TaxID=238106 RepID=UPI003F500A75